MKKSLLTILICAGLLTACGSTATHQSAPTTAPTQDAFQTDGLDIDIDEYISPEFDKFNSPASENGLGGTLVYIDGTFKKQKSEGYNGGIVDCGNNHKWYVMDGLQEVGAGFALLDDNICNDLDGKKIRVYGEYQGFSQLLNLPAVFIDRIVTEEGEIIGLGKVIPSQFSEQSEQGKASASDTLHVGDTWTVEGQWELTIDSFTETTERNEFAGKTPTAVYEIAYTYTNTGYDDDIMDGLYFDLSAVDVSLVDCAGKMGYSYPIGSDYPQETPIGATCTAKAYIGVDNTGTVTMHINKYDGDGKKQKATYELIPE